MRAKKIAAARTAAAKSNGPGFARSGDALASIGRPGFISCHVRRSIPSDPVEAHPVGAEVPVRDQGSGRAPEPRDSELAQEPRG